MKSIELMETFTEVLKSDPKHAYDFVSSNYNDMAKKELVAIIKELLYGIQCDCYTTQMERLLEDVAIELDEQYEEQYREIWST